MSQTPEDLEAMARVLEDSGRYRVLRQLDKPRHLTPEAIGQTRLGIMLDLETTGLDPQRDEIIEIGMAPFHYDADRCCSRLATRTGLSLPTCVWP